MLCQVYQWLISRAIDEGRRPGWLVRRHMAGCTECRGFWEAGLRLEERLRMGAFAAERPAGLRPTVAAVETVGRSAPQPVALPRRSATAADFGELSRALALRGLLRQRRRAVFAAAGAGLAAAVAVSVLAARLWPPAARPPAQVRPGPVARIPAGDLPTIGAIVGGDLMPSRSGAALQELAFAPMRRELANLAKDSESAARALLAVVYVDPGRRTAGPQTTRTR